VADRAGQSYDARKNARSACHCGSLPIFKVTNHHVESCGEQAIVYNRLKHAGMLYVGDAGWETAHAVADGVVPGLVLGDHGRAFA